MSKYITVKSLYADNGKTVRIKLDAGGAINSRQVARAVAKVCIGGDDYIKIDASQNEKPVTIFDQNGNYAGEIY